MVTTVTLNPALDRTLEFDSFKVGELNRPLSDREDMGGKGINVSTVLKNLGLANLAQGFIAGPNGEKILNQLSKLGIDHKFVALEEENTRINTKLISLSDNVQTEINDLGFMVTEDKLNELIKQLVNTSNPGDIVVLSGSAPRGLEENVYYRLMDALKDKDVKIILDVDTNYLLEGMKAKPFLIKPNLAELEGAFNFKAETLEDVTRVCSDIIKGGISNVIVSLGGKGALLYTDDEILYAYPIKVKIESCVAAGDSMVAGMAYGINKQYSIEESFKLAVACATATVTHKGTKTGSKEEILNYLKQVKILRIK